MKRTNSENCNLLLAVLREIADDPACVYNRLAQKAIDAVEKEPGKSVEIVLSFDQISETGFAAACSPPLMHGASCEGDYSPLIRHLVCAGMALIESFIMDIHARSGIGLVINHASHQDADVLVAKGQKEIKEKDNAPKN